MATARTIGVLTHIIPGMEIWEHNNPEFDMPDRGGIVVAVDSGGPDTIDDNGDLVSHPARYRCYDPYASGWPAGSFRWVSEPDIDRARVGVVDPWRLSRAVRRFALEVAGVRNRRRQKDSNLDSLEAQLVLDAARLAAVVMGGH